MKIGDIVRDNRTTQLGIIVSKYIGHRFDWEVVALGKPFKYGHVQQDCFKEEQLERYHGELQMTVKLTEQLKQIMDKIVLEAI